MGRRGEARELAHADSVVEPKAHERHRRHDIRRHLALGVHDVASGDPGGRRGDDHDRPKGGHYRNRPEDPSHRQNLTGLARWLGSESERVSKRGGGVQNTKATILGIIVAAIVALLLLAFLTSLLKTILEAAIVVGAIYLIIRVLMKKKK